MKNSNSLTEEPQQGQKAQGTILQEWVFQIFPPKCPQLRETKGGIHENEHVLRLTTLLCYTNRNTLSKTERLVLRS